jgi:hypothetical protein
MNSKKWAILFVIVMMVAVLATGCGGGSTTPAPTPDPEPPAVVGAAIPHALDGAYENCIGCHGDNIAESHADFDGYEESCLDCHEAE